VPWIKFNVLGSICTFPLLITEQEVVFDVRSTYVKSDIHGPVNLDRQ